ncbi:hypothetical protein CFOL_v3_18598 [Cephalotus follicularis]|uniref:F-box domain-containing protein n=1 Tax=Cephalotus follicularis TaxID=3775 RepID=A0A1Q3C4F8_CEPFO|nr:hypothetical protein CFOL_v3_18598 [Cephalotus follicularis]
MENQLCDLKDLSGELLADIAARLDGSTLAFTACTCSDLRDIAQDQSLWRQLCYSTWPSTALEEAQHLLSSSTIIKIGGFRRIYADSYPLILYEKPDTSDPPKPFKNQKLKHGVCPSDFASFVDVYYKHKCIFSKVLDGITKAVDGSEENELGSSRGASTNDNNRWFLNSPFTLDLLNTCHDENIVDEAEIGFVNNGYDNYPYDDGDGERLAPVECGKSQEDHATELMENIRLSWVLLDKRKGKAVNLSSWKPMLVKKSWPFDFDYVMHFGCVVPVEEGVVPHQLAKCIIEARCTITEKERYPQLREIRLRIEDLAGTHVSGGKSLIILNQTLYCSRSRNCLKVKEGYSQYEKQKEDLTKRKQFKEKLSDCLCLSTEVAVFAILFYYFIYPF